MDAMQKCDHCGESLGVAEPMASRIEPGKPVSTMYFKKVECLHCRKVSDVPVSQVD